MTHTLSSAVLSMTLTVMFTTKAQSNDELGDFMPRSETHTSMWWRDGFPGLIPEARWHRCIQTKHFGLVFETPTLTIPHFGALPPNADEHALFQLPPAELDLQVTVAGKVYHGKAGGEWTRYTGPRLIESGRFFQRGDITDLAFKSEDGTVLNAEMRLETAAWSDRLAFILTGRPGVKPIEAGEVSFGRVRGGFGLDGDNAFVIPEDPALATAHFTMEFWAFIPADYQAGKNAPWLFCRGKNELSDGNIGILLKSGASPEVRLNLGGGRENLHTLSPAKGGSLKLDQWNHLAVSYDNKALQLYTNGQIVAEEVIGKERIAPPAPITFGRRGDNSGDGYRFRGVIDEVRYYDRALKLEEFRQHFNKPETDRPSLKPLREWTFHEEGKAAMKQLREKWGDAAMGITLGSGGRQLSQKWTLPPGTEWSDQPEQLALTLHPEDFSPAPETSAITVEATETGKGQPRPVTFDAAIGWHRINLDGIDPILPEGTAPPSNDALERIKLTLSNPEETEQVARLMFEKTSRGIRQRIGAAITGVSAILRDENGNPTGIPVQLSKNWHNDAEGGTYAEMWFHGITEIELPAKSSLTLELTIAYGHWGGVPASSHAQLSLIGWGGNQLWEQSALGSWGESLCYNPEQTQANCTITDVRPLMVTSMGKEPQWGWTNNVGGGDFFRFFDTEENRVPHASMRTVYHRQGPCLTEVTYAGQAGPHISIKENVSLSRTDDLVRGTYRIRMDVSEGTDFSRFVIFQIGADTYNSTREKRFALGDASGVKDEWNAQWGGDTYRTQPKEATGKTPWVSLHEAETVKLEHDGAWANRGFVIREWKARLGGKDASPWIAERGLTRHKQDSSTIDLVPPPGLTRFEAGDFVEATIEHIIVPQSADDYYGPNESLRAALTRHPNSWETIHREAEGNDRTVEVSKGKLIHRYPDIAIEADADEVAFTLDGGIGYVPLTFSNLSSHRGYVLILDGEPLDQSVHGNDFWQSDYDAEAGKWSRTYNIPIEEGATREVTLKMKQ
ncbi:MAG: LamG domain-containing protein [Verrucomicrobiales bacterium]|nr:LamG domain-containing protein [Verrucomicrobiales bacterium]